MPGLLDGKVTLVTGAASGIGRASAGLFAREGASAVVLVDLDAGTLADAEAEVAAAGAAPLAVAADVRRRADVAAAVSAAVERFGRLDAAYNNAGIGGRVGLLTDYEDGDFDAVLDVDLRGVYHCLRHELEQMLAQEGGGAIVNCSSITGVTGFPPDMPALAAAKHGVEGLTKAAALEYATQGIRVNCVRPGTIRTPAVQAAIDAAGPEFEQRAIESEPVGRLGRPEEVAEAVCWLLSDRASFVTGTGLAVDGGFLAR